MMYWGDWTFILLLPALILSVWAQARVKSAFNKYSGVLSRRGITGRDAAREIMNSVGGLAGVPIREIPGALTDHYDPRDRSLSLSREVYESTSIAAIGVAAHEVGHAIQHERGYSALKVRNAIVPVVSLTSQAAMPLFFIGLLMSSPSLMNVGIFLFTGVLAFHLVTLPVELDASRRALAVLSSTGILAPDELRGARSVLRAAAMTYVSATLMSALQLLRLILIRNARSRD